MKILSPALLAALALLLPSCHTSQVEQRRTQPAPATQAQEPLQRFFEGSFQDPFRPAPNQALSLEGLRLAQDSVWAAWVRANATQITTGLPVLRPLPANVSDQSLVGNYGWRLSDENYGEQKFPATMPFYYGSKGAKPTAGYPLFLYLHGSGPKAAEWRTGLQLAEYFQDSPSVYFIPQIPNGEGVAGGQLYRWWQSSKLEAWEKLLRLSFLTDYIDPLRIYFFGISEGGYGTQRLASYYADYLAAAGPMAGGEPLINAPVENLENIGFSLRTGYDDTAFHRSEFTETAKAALDELEATHPGKYKHFVETIRGYQHAIPYEPTTPWLAQFKREPQPKSVHWEDLAIDGRHRRGFYNLVPLQRPSGEERTYYEEAIQNNVVDLKISRVTYHDEKVSDFYKAFRLVLTYSRTYTPATGGRLRVYLSPEIVDLSKPVRIRINGREVFSGRVEANLKHLASSCALFYDPARLFPAAVEVDY